MADDKDLLTLVSTKARRSRIGAVIIGLVTLIVPAAAGLLAFWDQISARFLAGASDLRVVLDVLPLDGGSSMDVSGRKFYLEGAKVDAILRHNHEGDESVLIKNVNVVLAHYDAKNICDSKLSGDDIFGAGELKPNVYVATLNSTGVASIIWKNPKDGATPVIAGSDLLESAPQKIVTPNGANDAESLHISLEADEAGTYEAYFLLRYVADGDTTKEYATEHIFICKSR